MTAPHESDALAAILDRDRAQQWAQAAGAARVAIEGSGNYGRPAALALAAAGIEVVEVPPQMTARARRGRRSAAKTDQVDALLVARIGARDADLPPPRPGGTLEELRCLVNYRRELVRSRTAHICRCVDFLGISLVILILA